MSKNTTLTDKTFAQLFVLNYISNINSTLPVENENELENNIQKINDSLRHKDIANFIGQWKIVWGPGICNTLESNYAGERFVTDNAMYMVQSQDDSSQYFIGISGTNAISFAGWFKQDFEVSKTVAWPPAFLNLSPAQKGNIALGAANGLENLWKMKPKGGSTLIDFIYNNVEDNSSISIGGHSLGGCLSPVLTAAIADSVKQNRPEKTILFTTLPTAGPTPGDVDFANHLNTLSNYQGLYNTNDLVPLAWKFDQEEMNSFLNDYRTFSVAGHLIVPTQTIIQNFIGWARKISAKNNYTRQPHPIPSSFKVSKWKNGQANNAKQADVDLFRDKVLKNWLVKEDIKTLNGNQAPSDEELNNFARFFLEVGAQHVEVYKEHLRIPQKVNEALASLFRKNHNIKTRSWIGLQIFKELSHLISMAANQTPSAGVATASILETHKASFTETEAQEIAECINSIEAFQSFGF